MPNINNSERLLRSATSSPENNRLIFSWNENGACFVEVQDCFQAGALTFETNGDATEILCYNRVTQQNEVVGTIDSGATQKATFDIERYLPSDYLSNFLEIVRRNCGLRMYMARADSCIDPFDVNDFRVLDMYGVVTFGNYTRSEMLHKQLADAGAITEGTTVTAYDLQQAGPQSWAERGELSTDPIVAAVICDKLSCGGLCEDDSDGCQKVIWTDAVGRIGYTTNQFFNEAIIDVLNQPVLDAGGVITDICCVKGQLVLTESDGANFGQIHTTDLSNLLDGNAPTWNTISVDTSGNPLAHINACELTSDESGLWLPSDGGNLYQYNPTTAEVIRTPVIAGLVSDFLWLDVLGQTIAMGGSDATLVRSNDSARSFQLLTIIDPVTGIELVNTVVLLSGDVLAEGNIAVGTDDDRILYTLDDGLTWRNQVIPTADGTGTIDDLHFDSNLIGWAVRNAGGVGELLKTYYGNCQPWLSLPETNDPLVDNQGFAGMINCKENPNVAIAWGTNDAGAGLLLVGTSEYR